MNNRTQAKVAEELGMQEFAITNDKTKRPVALRTKTLADLLECESVWFYSSLVLTELYFFFLEAYLRKPSEILQITIKKERSDFLISYACISAYHVFIHQPKFLKSICEHTREV